MSISANGRPCVSFPISLGSGHSGLGWTDIIDTTVTGLGASVGEHPAAAVVFAGLDNVEIMLDYPTRRPASGLYKGGHCSSFPLLSGTPEPYLRAIQEAGVIQQAAPRNWLTVPEELTFQTGRSLFRLSPRSAAGWSMHVVNAPDPSRKSSWWWENQVRESHYDLLTPGVEFDLQAIVIARPTNGTWRDWALFRTMTLGSGRKADFCVMHSPWSPIPVDGQLPYAEDEAIRHRQIDVTGDTRFFIGNLQADMYVENGSHAATHRFRQWLLQLGDIFVLSSGKRLYA